MGREAEASVTMRLLQVETIINELAGQLRQSIDEHKMLMTRVNALEAQTAAMIALHADDYRRVQTAIGLVQTLIYGTLGARLRWLLGL